MNKQTKGITKKKQSDAKSTPSPSPSASASLSTSTAIAPSSTSSPSPAVHSRSWSNIRPPLSSSLLSYLSEHCSFSTATPVQSVVIPLLMSHKDVCVQAETGSGKTLSFAIPLFQLLLSLSSSSPTGSLPSDRVYSIILSPTRELSLQIESIVRGICVYLKQFTCTSLIGGENIDSQIQSLYSNGCNVVIATPGRLEAVLNGKVGGVSLDVKYLELLVLDEADRLLSEGFHHSLNNILNKLPKQRRTGLFSATQTKEIKELARAGLRNPVQINVQKPSSSSSLSQSSPSPSSSVPNSLENYYFNSAYSTRSMDLYNLILHHSQQKMIVFFLSCAQVDYFSLLLSSITPTTFPFPLAPLPPIIKLHGQLSQSKRNAHYEQFVEMKGEGVLLTTDLAARGLDIADVDLIIQFDPPTSFSFFSHRIGRTARAGKRGKAIVMVDCSTEEEAIIHYAKNQKIPLSPFPSFPPAITDLSLFLSSLHSLHLNDRLIMEYGQSSFVSFVRAYKEHELKQIFPLNLLPFAGVATGYGLLFLPLMNDLKHFNINFVAPIKGLKASHIPYADKQREAIRLKNSKEKAVKRQEEQEQREREQAEKRKAKTAAGPKRRNKRINEEMANEWKELQTEQRMIKKLKNGSIDKKQYDRALLGAKGGGGTKGEDEGDSDSDSHSDSD